MESLASDDCHALIVTLLHGDSLLRWRGEIVNLPWLRTSSEAGLELLHGDIGTHVADLGLGTWLVDLQANWRAIMAELLTPDAEKEAYGMLFKRMKAHNLSTALRLAVAVPRLHGIGTWGAIANGRLAGLAAETSDTGFTIPSGARLKELFVMVMQGLREGALSILDNRRFYECTLIMAWRYEGRTLLESVLFREALTAHLRANRDRRLLQSLVFGYFRDFTVESPEFVTFYAMLIREHLGTGATRDFAAWRNLDATWNLFAGLDAPALCASRLKINATPEEALQALGLVGANLWGAFSAELLLAWIAHLGRDSLGYWQTIRQWFEKAAGSSFAHREYRWIDTVVRPWINQPPAQAIRIEIGRYLVDRFSEPENSAAVWAQCLPEVRDTVRQWLFLGNLETFFELIADYAETTGGEMRLQWAYRKAFWLAVHRTNAVANIRIAVGDGILSAFGMVKLKNCFGSHLARLDDTDEHRCALILEINDLIVVDFTHNAKCRVWQTGRKQREWFSQTRLLRGEFRDGTDKILRPHYSEPGIAHFSSENYGWQDALAEYFRAHSSIRISRRDYECR